MVMASHWVGVDLARHDAASRLVLWQTQLTQPTTRARTEEADIIGNLHEGASKNIESPVSLDKSIMGSQRFELRQIGR